MLNETLNSLALFQDYILFSVIVLVFFAASGSLIRISNWKSPVLRVYGIFTGMGPLRLIALSLILIRMLFFISALIYSTEINLPHIYFVVMVTVILHIILLDRACAVFDVLCTAVIFGELYVGNLLNSYLSDIQFKFIIFGSYFILIIFTLITVFYCTILCISSLTNKNLGIRPKLNLKMVSYQALILVAGLFVTFVPYYFINSMDTLYITQELYQNTSEGRVTFSGVNKIAKSSRGCVLENNDRLYELKSVPLYYKNENSILVPNIVTIVQPDLYLTNRLENMTRIYEKDGQYHVNNNGDEVRVSDFFLFDGRDTYVFFEPITINWQNNSIELSPFSYVTVKYNHSIQVYDRSTMNLSNIDTGICNVTAKMRCNARINLSTDILQRQDGQEQMLFIQPNLLEDLI